MTWKGFLQRKVRQRDLTNKQVYIAVAVAFIIGWILG